MPIGTSDLRLAPSKFGKKWLVHEVIRESTGCLSAAAFAGCALRELDVHSFHMDNLTQLASLQATGTLAALAITALWIAPLIVSREICMWRNRSTAKATVIALLFGWFGTLGLWLVLKTRRPDGTLV